MTSVLAGFPAQVTTRTLVKGEASPSYPVAYDPDEVWDSTAVLSELPADLVVTLTDSLVVVDDTPDEVTATRTLGRFWFKGVALPLSTLVESATLDIDFTIVADPEVDGTPTSDPIYLDLTLEATPTRVTDADDSEAISEQDEFPVVRTELIGTSLSIDIQELMQAWVDRGYPVETGESFGIVASLSTDNLAVGSVGVVSTTGEVDIDSETVTLNYDLDEERAFDLRSTYKTTAGSIPPVVWMPFRGDVYGDLEDTLADLPELNWRAFFVADDYSKHISQPDEIDVPEALHWHNFYAAEQDPDGEITLGNDDLFATEDGPDLQFTAVGGTYTALDRWAMLFGGSDQLYLASGAPTAGGPFTPALAADWSLVAMILPTTLGLRGLFGFSSTLGRHFRINNSSGAVQLNLGANITSSNGAVNTSDYQLLRIFHDSGTGTSYVYVNEVLVVSGSAGTFTPDYLSVGAAFGTTLKYSGRIGMLGWFEGDVAAEPEWGDFYRFAHAWYANLPFRGDATAEVTENLPTQYYGAVDDGDALTLDAAGWVETNLTSWDTHKPIADDILNSGEYSVSCWISTPNIDIQTYVRFANRGFWIMSPGDGMIDFIHYDSADDLWFVRSETNWADGVEHHVVGTYDGTDLRLYIDGSLEATEPADPIDLLVTVDDGLAVGRNGPITAIPETDGLLQGTVRDLVIASRALTGDEVLALYEANEDQAERFMETGRVGFI